MKSFILASGSPRRKELLQQAHLSFSIETSTVEEIVEEGLKPEEVVQQLALQKAKDVWSKHPQALVLGSDTVVAYQSDILGKPADEKEAKAMLETLSGNIHSVYTGVALCSQEETITFYEKTDVEFYPLSEEDIEMYIRSGEPFDKAGSYGIQGFGAFLVKRIIGDYFAVVGLPLAKTVRELRKRGIHPNM
ncbi:Maf family protein [Halalkalibacter akibai]|uniref:dTTP/UTP pyrophosphatase n=1 Tax=Halalkalibacter akibai (strain ATCC 43226 / DSM 21942 / CIP 109018 / JCM 9157 / 1139) TaxID=1236973 RepID=W4QS72_HALA3|nr:Maf family protein [Halalkalibacter akibai]GAE34955.1 septum formation protein Maf [Halalkalibacter akibai JCM 9157]